MKLVIEIPEDEYNAICNNTFETDGYFRMNLSNAFKNGIPLPKGDGRLIDADAITKDLNTLRDAFRIYQQTADKSSVSIVCTAETILEADKDGD